MESKVNVGNDHFTQAKSATFYKNPYTYARVNDEWMIGDGTENDANAVGGLDNCPKEIVFPGTLSSLEYPKPASVSIIGYSAFRNCGNISGRTVSIFIPKEVKIIQDRAFEFNYYVESFDIEAGSRLEVIGFGGIDSIGHNIDQSFWTASLILPETVREVHYQGLWKSSLFAKVFYCGWTELSNDSSLNNDGGKAEIYVKSFYQYENALGYVPLKTEESYEEAEKTCRHHFTWPCKPQRCSCQNVNFILASFFKTKLLVFIKIFLITK